MLRSFQLAKCYHSLRGLLVIAIALSAVACGSQKSKKASIEPSKLTEFERSVELSKVWSRKIGNGQGKDDDRLSLSVSAQGICAASVNGYVYCLGHDGGVLWRQRVADRISAGVGSTANRVFVVDSDGNLIVLDRQNGEQLWSKNIASQVLAAPQSDDESIVVQTTDGRLLALDASTGDKRWEYIADEPRLTLKGTATPVLVDGTIYTGFANGKIVALSLTNGALEFDNPVAIASGTSEIERLVDIDSAPFIDSGSVYTVSYNGNLFAFDQATGKPQWRYETSSYRDLATGLNKVYLVDDSSQVFALDQKTGDERWQQADLLYRQLSAATVFAGYVIVGDYKGYLHVLSQVDGRVVGRERADRSAINVPMGRYADQLYVYSDDGKLTAFRLNVTN